MSCTCQALVRQGRGLYKVCILSLKGLGVFANINKFGQNFIARKGRPKINELKR